MTCVFSTSNFTEQVVLRKKQLFSILHGQINKQIETSFIYLLSGFLFFFLFFCQLDDDTDAWIETINFQSRSNLFDSFNIVIPEDQSKKSFTRSLLESSNLDKLVREIRYLARRVVLCKHIKDEDKTPGTVYVYEVIVTYEENNVVIKEMVIHVFHFS